jgi:hypothetical protein
MDWDFDNAPTPMNDFDHVAFEAIRLLGSIEELNKKYGKLGYAIKLAKQALAEIEDAETQLTKELN